MSFISFINEFVYFGKDLTNDLTSEGMKDHNEVFQYNHPHFHEINLNCMSISNINLSVAQHVW